MTITALILSFILCSSRHKNPHAAAQYTNRPWSNKHWKRSLEFIWFLSTPIWSLYNTAAENSINEVSTHHTFGHSIKKEQLLFFSKLFIFHSRFLYFSPPHFNLRTGWCSVSALHCPGSSARTTNQSIKPGVFLIFLISETLQRKTFPHTPHPVYHQPRRSLFLKSR